MLDVGEPTKDEIIEKELLLYKGIIPNIDKLRIVSISGIDKIHDKTIKSILSEESEMAEFLKQYLQIDLKCKKLEKYKNSFITSGYKSKESDTIYKIKDKNIYYLIEHQSSVDIEMPRRILTYCDQLIEDVKKGKVCRENPLIIPIVIYTGNRKWKVAKNFAETQDAEKEEEEFKIKLKYKLIDIKNYSKEELLKIDTKLSNMMLIEKCNNSEEIRNVILEILIKTKDKHRKKWVKEILTYVIPKELGKEEMLEIIENIESEEQEMDEEWLERVRKNDAKFMEKLIKKGEIRGKKIGETIGERKVLETIATMIKTMIKNNEDDEKIMKYTNAKKEDIDKIRRELEMQAEA